MVGQNAIPCHGLEGIEGSRGSVATCPSSFGGNLPTGMSKTRLDRGFRGSLRGILVLLWEMRISRVKAAKRAGSILHCCII